VCEIPCLSSWDVHLILSADFWVGKGGSHDFGEAEPLPFRQVP